MRFNPLNRKIFLIILEKAVEAALRQAEGLEPFETAACGEFLNQQPSPRPACYG